MSICPATSNQADSTMRRYIAPQVGCMVAHTANDALEVIDCVHDRYLRSIPNLTGVAGALVSHERDLVFTSNVKERRMTASVAVPSRTRWAVFDGQAECFYVNIAAPAQILVLLPLAIIVFFARFSISQMDVPARQSYTMALVAPDERSAAAGVTGIARSIGAAISLTLAGLFLSNPGAFGAPFFVAGGLKIVYDILLYHGFRSVKEQAT